MAERAPILAVDDDERNLLALEAMLGELDVELVKARSGREALRILLSRSFPVVLLDVQMPEMDGFETAELIRGATRTRHIPIIFLTANADLSRVATAYSKGAVDYLTKPLVPEILRAKISVFVELHRAQERERRRAIEEEKQRWESAQLRARLEQEQLAREQERAAAEALASANRRLEGALEQTRRALEARDEFLQMASHELKTPLTSLRLALENVLRHPIDEKTNEGSKVKRTLKVMGGQIERLSALVEELLSVVIVQGEQIRLSPARVDLAEAVQMALEDLAYSVETAKCDVEVKVETEGEGDRVVGWWDSFWLSRVLGNLIANAVKFGAGRPLQIRVARERGRALVSVRDHGIGISEAQHERIFEPFERGVSSSNYGGLGLGLFIVRRIVAAHGGSVRVKSELGSGATFTVELPLGAA